MNSRNVYKPLDQEDLVDRAFRERLGYRDFAQCPKGRSVPCDGSCIQSAREFKEDAVFVAILAAFVGVWWLALR